MADFVVLNNPTDDEYAGADQNSPIIRLKNFEFSEKNFLGEGNFAAVFKGRNIKTGEEVAIKRIIKKKIDIEPKLVQGMKTEVEIMTRKDVDHSHLIKLHYFEETNLYYYLVLELCRSDLGKIIKARREKLLGKNAPFSQPCTQPCIPEDVAGMFFIHLIFGLNGLHQRNLLHRDLKPENLLLLTNPLEKNPPAWDECTLKLADFGFSRHLGTDTQLAQTVCGTPLYMSPEIINGSTYGKKSDIWSCGCILYEMLTGVPPFIAQSQNLLTQKISAGQVSYPPYISPECQRCIYQLLRKNPQNRHDMEKIVNEPFFLKYLTAYKIRKEGPKKGLSTPPQFPQQFMNMNEGMPSPQAKQEPLPMNGMNSPNIQMMKQQNANSPMVRPLPKTPKMAAAVGIAAVGVAELDEDLQKFTEEEKKVGEKKKKLQNDLAQKLKK